MNVINNFVFFSNVSSTGDSNILKNLRGSELVINVNGTATYILSIQGLVNIEDNNWTALATINASDYSVANTITANGSYIIGIDGIAQIKVNISAISGGNVSVFGRLGE